jgi:hypothetical protein
MFDHVFYSVLSTIFNLTFAILPAAPLFALKKATALSKNSPAGMAEQVSAVTPTKTRRTS